MAQGLRYMHSLNMLHRDIKPANILLDREVFVFFVFAVAMTVCECAGGYAGPRGAVILFFLLLPSMCKCAGGYDVLFCA